MDNESQHIEFSSIEAKSRFATLFPKDLKFLIKILEEYKEGFDVDPLTGFSESLMMKKRTMLKLQAYLELFNGLDPEELSPAMVDNHLPADFLEKYEKEIDWLWKRGAVQNVKQ
jgi:hypothetical protein